MVYGLRCLADRGRMEPQAKARCFLSIGPMSSFKLPRAVSWPLTIQRGEAQLSAALAVVFDDQSLVLNQLARELFGPNEFAYFSTLPFRGPPHGYPLRRYPGELPFGYLLHHSNSPLPPT